MQRRAALWIVGTFKMSSSMGIEAITSPISINLHLQKIRDRSQLRVHSLPPNHILQSLMSPSPESLPHQHTLLLNTLTRRQCSLIKGHMVDMKNHFNKVFPSFDPINPEFYPGNRIINTHTNCFSFHLFNKHISHNIKSHIQELDKIAIESSDDPSSILIITDTSIKNNVAISITHIHVRNKPITKILHHALNIMSTEAELFAIRCSINQATNIGNISKVIVVMDSIHAVEKNFDPFFHPFQKHSVSILKDL